MDHLDLGQSHATDARGTVGDFTFAASHQLVVREVQALVTN